MGKDLQRRQKAPSTAGMAKSGLSRTVGIVVALAGQGRVGLIQRIIGRRTVALNAPVGYCRHSVLDFQLSLQPFINIACRGVSVFNQHLLFRDWTELIRPYPVYPDRS